MSPVLRPNLLIAAHPMGMAKQTTTGQRFRTAVVPVRLHDRDYQRAHDACHALAGLWNNAVEWLLVTWEDGLNPDAYGIKKYITTLEPELRPVHAHTAQEVAFDLYEAVTTYRENKRQGNGDPKPPHKSKKYRPLTFTRGFGWRVVTRGGTSVLSMSLGRGRDPIQTKLPTITDPATGRDVPPELWGEIRLCWDVQARRWSLRIAVPASLPKELDPDKAVAIDEGIINPMTLAAYAPDSTDERPVIDVLVINGREARAIKRHRNKEIGKLQRAQSKVPKDSRRHKTMTAASKKVRATADSQLHDHNHQVTAKATKFIQDHDAGKVVAGDVRDIANNTRKEKRVNRSSRQQCSQWDRGKQEDLLQHKTGVPLDHISERYSSRTCPMCLKHNHPRGRNYRCHGCGFVCHRDAVGAINILMRILYGNYTRLDPNTQIRVMYLRAVPRFNDSQRARHSARSKAKNTPNQSNLVEPGASRTTRAPLPAMGVAA